VAEMHVVTTRFPEPTLAALRQEAAARQTAVSELVRRAVEEHVARQTIARAVPLLDATFGKHVDRLAALIAKTFTAADMASWQTRALVAALVRDQDPAAVMREARLRALVDLRQVGTDFGLDEDLYPDGGPSKEG
jgi:hypothetical protein